jgi:PAS domain S-box-containing protein
MTPGRTDGFAAMVELSNRAFARRRELSKQHAAGRSLDFASLEDNPSFRSIFDALPGAVLIGDNDGSLLDANQAGLELFGYNPAGLRRQSLVDIIEAREEWTVSEFGRFKRDGHWQGDLDIRRGSGGFLAVEAVARTFDLPAGAGFVAIVEQVPADAGARRRQREAAAQAAHELRAGVAPLAGLGELMARPRSSWPAPWQEPGAGSLLFESALGDLIQASAAERGRLTPAPVEGDLTAILNLEIERWQEATSVHRISLQAPRGSLPGYWDYDHVAQVLRSLIFHAMGRLPLGGHIRVSATDSCHEAVIGVTDEAAALRAADFHILCGDEGRPRDRDGMGLYTARLLVQANGGRTWAETEGRRSGTTICFSLPHGPR